MQTSSLFSRTHLLPTDHQTALRLSPNRLKNEKLIMLSWGVLLTGMMLIALTVLSLFFNAERRVLACELDTGCAFSVYKGMSYENTVIARENLIDSMVVHVANDGEVIGEARDVGARSRASGKGRKGYSVALLIARPSKEQEEEEETKSMDVKMVMGVLEDERMERSLWKEKLKDWRVRQGYEEGEGLEEDRMQTILLSSWAMSKSAAMKQEKGLNKFISKSFESFQFNGSKLFRFSFATFMSFLGGSFCMMMAVVFGKFTERGDYQQRMKDY